MARKKTRSDGPEGDLNEDPGAPEITGASDLPFLGPVPNDEPSLAGQSDFDLIMASPRKPQPETPASPPPAATPSSSPEALLVPLEERMRRLEEAITTLSRTQREAAPPSQPSGANVIHTAQALVDAGRHWLPALQLGAGSRAGWLGKLGFLGDIFAELQAIYYMYVDPRYRLSWMGRFVPLILLGLFLTTQWWLTFFACGAGSLFRKPVELMLLYLMFKIVTVEARHYRQTAPDLPPSLRL